MFALDKTDTLWYNRGMSKKYFDEDKEKGVGRRRGGTTKKGEIYMDESDPVKAKKCGNHKCLDSIVYYNSYIIICKKCPNCKTEISRKIIYYNTEKA